MIVRAVPAEPVPLQRQFFGKLAKMLREGGASEVARFLEWKDDPAGFIGGALGEHVWSKQRDICDSVVVNRKTAVQSCHDVGKSYIASRIAAAWLSTHEPGEAFVVSTAPTDNQVKAILWREMGRAHRKGRLPGRINQKEWLFGNEIVGQGRRPGDYDTSAFQGIHARYVLVIYDEACGVPKSLFDAGSSMAANVLSRELAIGNPDDPSAHFHKICLPGSGWNVIKISAFDSPNLTGEAIPDDLRDLLVSQTYVDEKLRDWGIENPLYQSKVLGEFPEVTDGTLISPKDIREARERDLKATGVRTLGVDVARNAGAGDRSTIVYRHGDVAQVIFNKPTSDTMAIVGQIMQVLGKQTIDSIRIDVIGWGAGVVDRLIELKREGKIPARTTIVPVNVGEKADDPKPGRSERFLNLRAQYYWSLRDRYRDGAIKIEEGKTGEELAADLLNIKWDIDSTGRIYIEKKEDAKKRGVRSPDLADGLMLAFAPLGGNAEARLAALSAGEDDKDSGSAFTSQKF